MEKQNATSIPLVDVLSEVVGERVVMDGEDYVIFSSLEAISKDIIDKAILLKEQKEKELSVPVSITARQVRLTLLHIGKLDDVAIAIDSLPSPTKEQIKVEWEYATTIQRNNPFIETLGYGLGLDKEKLDELFIYGAKIE